jgi:hypothetical protein
MKTTQSVWVSKHGAEDKVTYLGLRGGKKKRMEKSTKLRTA